MPRFSKLIPQTPLELERFYLDVVTKLGGTEATLDEVDQRSTYPGASVTSELDRSVRDLFNYAIIPMRAQISELERQLRNMQGQSLSTKVDDLERRIDSIEKSARF